MLYYYHECCVVAAVSPVGIDRMTPMVQIEQMHIMHIKK